MSTDGVSRQPVVVTDDVRQRVARHPLGRQPDPRRGTTGPSTAPTPRRSWRGSRRSSRHATGPPRSDAWSPPRPPRARAPAHGPRAAPGCDLRVRWLGTVPYREAWTLQQALPRRPRRPPARTACSCWSTRRPTPSGRNADRSHVLVDPAGWVRSWSRSTGAATSPSTVRASWWPTRSSRCRRKGRRSPAGLPDTPGLRRAPGAGAHRCARRRSACPTSAARTAAPGCGWSRTRRAARKVAAIGVRIERGRSLHGIALNVDHRHGVVRPHRAVRHHRQGRDVARAPRAWTSTVRAAARRVRRRVRAHWRPGAGPSAATWSWRTARDRPGAVQPRRGPGRPTGGANAVAAVDPPAGGRHVGAAAGPPGRGGRGRVGRHSPTASPTGCGRRCATAPACCQLKQTVRDLGLVTVCEEAGCPNLSECWSEGTATFMVCGERCTRACGFCLVDTRRPEPLDAGEPDRVAEAVQPHGAGLRRDHDGGPRRPARRWCRPRGGDRRGHPRRCARTPQVEALISDLQGRCQRRWR